MTAERRGTEKTPKIPYVCDELEIPCLSIVEFIRTARWQFSEAERARSAHPGDRLTQTATAVPPTKL